MKIATVTEADIYYNAKLNFFSRHLRIDHSLLVTCGLKSGIIGVSTDEQYWA